MRALLIHPAHPPVRAHPVLTPPPCVPISALPRRVRFAFHLCSYAKRMFSRLPSCLSPLPASCVFGQARGLSLHTDRL